MACAFLKIKEPYDMHTDGYINDINSLMVGIIKLQNLTCKEKELLN